MQKPPVFSMCIQDGNCGYIKPSAVGGKTEYRWETSDLCLEKLRLVRDCYTKDFMHVGKFCVFSYLHKF